MALAGVLGIISLHHSSTIPAVQWGTDEALGFEGEVWGSANASSLWDYNMKRDNGSANPIRISVTRLYMDVSLNNDLLHEPAQRLGAH